MATAVCSKIGNSYRFSNSVRSFVCSYYSRKDVSIRSIHQTQSLQPVNFGFLFDIDGVIVRGKKLLPSAKDAFNLLIDKYGKFKVPVLFVTNAGNTLRQNKAKALSEWLGIEIHTDQVVMSHSPLKMFQHFRDKHILVSGQGPVFEIARALGFNNITSMETLRQCFPHLDMVDHRRRKPAPCAFEQYFPKIDAVVLFGEPVRWETCLQLILDVLLTNGKPSTAPKEIPYPHLPLLGCNMDLLWMSEACMPRFGHGCFLHCLESLYQKISGRELKYTALVGKPSELTYHHADYLLHEQALKMGMKGVKTIYCIGDNPESDIYGANLYNRSLKKRLQARPMPILKQKARQNIGPHVGALADDSDDDILEVRGFEETPEVYAENCESILVCTGVYHSSHDYVTYGSGARTRVSNHNHRDFVLDPLLTEPKYVAQNVLDAVKLVFKQEDFRGS